MVRRTNVELIVQAIDDLEEATTAEIIGWIHRQGCKSPPPRVVSQICSCMKIIEKKGMKCGYVIWGKAKDFDKNVNMKGNKIGRTK